MKFHALLPVRDEADIIGQCLQRLLDWADSIYVFDTGSVDETWEIVQEFSRNDKRVRLLRKDPVYFSDTHVRAWIFNSARRHMRTGDWFLRVDADEFHHIPPPEFVKTHLRPFETIVYHQYYDFVLRESEVLDWELGRETLADRVRPIEERRQWYIPSIYSEPRLCRYRDTMEWPPTASFPFNAGYLARARLPIRHYPHRDPTQLKRRCRLRAIVMADEKNRSNWLRPELHHWTDGNWRSFIISDDAAGLERWVAGSNLPAVQFCNHLPKRHIRVAQRLAHQFLLPVLDRLRPRWPEDAYPQKMPPQVTSILERELETSMGD